MYVPFTGLGLYNGFRGNRWLRNRIKVFKEFVIPSLLNQTSHEFTLWISWRREERHNPYVLELKTYLDTIKEFRTIYTFSGVCFYDDKYNEVEARERLITAIHSSTAQLLDEIGECDYVLMTIQPSDDLYHKSTVANIQQVFNQTDLQAVGFTKGFMCNYPTKEVAEYNPNTNPPFYTVKFPRESFIDPLKHAKYTALKKDVGDYKVGTPCPSHEYVPDCLKYGKIDIRGFVVGTHSENISTVFNHPFRGPFVSSEVLQDFGIDSVAPLKLKSSWRKQVLRKLPHKWQRKIRYIFGESVWKIWYNFLRS